MNDDEPQHTERRRSRSWIVLIALLALVLGGGGGYAIRALTTPPPAPVVVVAPPPPPAPTVPPSAACAATTQLSAELIDQLRQAVDAAGRLDPAALRSVLDRVQVLQGQLTAAAGACAGSGSTAPPGG